MSFKSVILVLISCVSLQSFADDKANVAFLIKLDRNTGFSPRPAATSVVVDQSGRVYKLSTDIKSNESNVFEIAQLSDESLARIKAAVAAVKSGKLEDTNPSRPKCAGGGTSSVVIKKGSAVNSKEVTIQSSASCHDSRLAGADELISLVRSFNFIAP